MNEQKIKLNSRNYNFDVLKLHEFPVKLLYKTNRTLVVRLFDDILTSVVSHSLRLRVWGQKTPFCSEYYKQPHNHILP